MRACHFDDQPISARHADARKAKQNLEKEEYSVFAADPLFTIGHAAKSGARRQEAVNVVFAATAFQNNENAGNGANEENHDHAPLDRCLLAHSPSALSFSPCFDAFRQKIVSVFDRANALPSPDGWFYVAAIENTNPR